MRTIVRLHRWLGLGALVFWVVQALTGVLILFNWEVDDALLAAENSRFDAVAIERSLEDISSENPDAKISSVWTSGSGNSRFDVYLSGPDGDHTVRIDGSGQILRVRGDESGLANGGWIEILVLVHHNLLSGDIGSWIVGISGSLLLSNIVMGVVLARPWKVGWANALKPVSPKAKQARRYSWHRAVGLWAAIPVFITVSAGVLLVFYDGLEAAMGTPPRTTVIERRDGTAEIGVAQAVNIALSEFKQSSLTAVTMPGDGELHYSIRLRQDNELREIYGTTTVIVSAIDGRVLETFDARNASAERTFLDSLFAVHTGEAGGLAGRILMILVGLWILTVSILGALLWWSRTQRRRA